MSRLSLESRSLLEQHDLFNHRMSSMAGTLALRDQQLLDVNTQLAQVFSRSCLSFRNTLSLCLQPLTSCLQR